MNQRRVFLKNSLKYSALLGAGAVTLNTAAAGQAEGNDKTETDTNTVFRPDVERPARPSRQITVPDVEGFKVLKGDFHMHTLFSDGHIMPRERVIEAVDNGLDVISITDHIEYRIFLGGPGAYRLQNGNDDHNLSYNVAKPEAEKRNLLLIRGTEMTKFVMPPGHFNMLFVQDVNPIAAAGDDWRKMLQIAADQGAFLLWNHPGSEGSSFGIPKDSPLRFTPEHEEVYKKGLMHGIEIFNGSQAYPIVSDWCNERNLAMFANSDIHRPEEFLYGVQNPLRPITLVLAKERSLDSIREAFFDRRTIGMAAGMLWGREPWLPALFKASVAVKPLTPGRLELTNKSSLPIFVRSGGTFRELPKDKPCIIDRNRHIDSLTVENWIVAMNKRLKIPFESLV